MDTNRTPKQALQYKLKGRRNIGRPKKRWRDQFHFEDQETRLILHEHDNDDDDEIQKFIVSTLFGIFGLQKIFCKQFLCVPLIYQYNKFHITSCTVSLLSLSV